MTEQDFCSRALSSLTNQISLAAADSTSPNTADHSNTSVSTSDDDNVIIDVESFAQSLVEKDLPKIDAAVKSFLSLVAARSAVVSSTDIKHTTSTSTSGSMVLAGNCNDGDNSHESESVKNKLFESSLAKVRCTFASTSAAKTGSPLDSNRSALVCARALLATINSTIIPPLLESIPTTEGGESKHEDTCNDKQKQRLQTDAIRILWNGLVPAAPTSSTDKKKQMKPSKLLGRKSLIVAYPYVTERFHRGLTESDASDAKRINKADSSTSNDSLHSTISLEALPPVPTPKGIDADQWQAFYTEFGNLLVQACKNHDNDGMMQPSDSNGAIEEEDDSALLWSVDHGVAELQQRRERRAQRATDALASAESGFEILDDGEASVGGDAVTANAN